ncbi:MAG TPA: LuxR C-terminal-related transcriptional regulator [Rhodoglobus sp.]|nr:LuxR C-terminal-related transcriptional regulator [Rhodoglobus sp.]
MDDRRWPDVQAAVTEARDGRLAMLDLDGDAGFGKTTLLRRIARSLDGFVVRRAFGEEGADPAPFTLLGDLIGAGPGEIANTLQGTRLLAAAVDHLQGSAPVALLVDDLQWVDAESVDALAALALRDLGSRLLIVTAHRPLRASHTLWRRAVRDVPARTIVLDGLDTAEVEQLVRASLREPPAGLVEALTAHTGGNPLHVTALLKEHTAAELATMAIRDELPAPVELAARMGERVAALSSSASRLLRALAVLGDEWVDVGTAAAVADAEGPEAAAQVLSAEMLVRSDRSSGLMRLRLYHSVVRAAVYDAIPADERRRLHAAAAARHPDPQQRLRHRAAAAAPASDDGLALELAEHAERLHDRGWFRQAARLLRLAAHTTRSEDERHRRDLEADVESLLGRDPERVAATDGGTGQGPLERLVAAMRSSATGDWLTAWRTLQPVTDDELERSDALLAFRLRVLRAWTGVYAGRPSSEILVDAEAAERMPRIDPALMGQLWLTLAHARLTGLDEDSAWRLTGRGVDRSTLAAMPSGAAAVLWRGCALALFGAGEEAVADLALATDLIGEGALDVADVAYYGYFGLAEFQVGRWQRASVRFDVAGKSELGGRVPSMVALSSLIGTINGHADSARVSRQAARRWLVRSPYEIGIWAADIADVVSLALVGTDQERRAWASERVADLGDPLAGTYPTSTYLWIVAHGLAASWADDAPTVRRWAGILEQRQPVVPWYGAGLAWLRALAEAGEDPGAAKELARIAREGFGDLRAMTAIALVEAARVAERQGRGATAGELRSEASELVAAFGGRPSAPPDARDHRRRQATTSDPFSALSDREREVAFLVKEGLSYAQIAEELYVTRSTVGFHLTNCYAKTNTRSRHELANLVRSTGR